MVDVFSDVFLGHLYLFFCGLLIHIIYTERIKQCPLPLDLLPSTEVTHELLEVKVLGSAVCPVSVTRLLLHPLTIPVPKGCIPQRL